MIRLFAALEVPFNVAQELSVLQTGVPNARWRPIEAMHVTLRFFGEVSEPMAEDLDDALGRIHQAPFSVQIEGVGAFGEFEHMRAVWAGVAPCEPLARLAGKCETAARKLGLKGETRTYRPHITMAYLHQSPEPRVAAWVAQHNLLKRPPWTADRFGLYSSRLNTRGGPDGSRYTLEREYRL